MNLVIVESPTKAKTIGKFLSRNYKVLSSKGHLIDLPRSIIGVDVDDDFKPKYITIRGKGNILKELKTAAKKAKRVYLAGDPDREGEAICYHIGQALKLDPEQPCRVEFNEITRDAVKDAFKSPRLIDENRFEAQQARRILDRLVGYQISPLLWRKIRGGLSAGRVQSVAVRLICDREEEIEKFVPEEYWSLEAELQNPQSDENPQSDQPFRALLAHHGRKKIKPKTEEETAAVIDAIKGEQFIVDKVTAGKRTRNPLPPFTTSSLQQEASAKLGFTGRKTMSLAQQLYEGVNVGSGETVGLITYIRTDSTKVAQQARDEARSFIDERFGPDFIPAKPPEYKSRRGAQEAHEAIRPTAVNREPAMVKDYLNRDQNRLYKLIWNRFLAGQMAPALYDRVKVTIKVGDYRFQANGSTLRFPGFTVIYQSGEAEKDRILPKMEENDILKLCGLYPEQHFTKAPPRYNEASLVKILEEKGIGRPSTYSPIIETIQSRGYVIRENKVFFPTELGFLVDDLLLNYFPEIVDVDFTAKLEQQLDDIEEDKQEGIKVIRDFYDGFFRERLVEADRNIERVEIAPEVSEETCVKCGENLIFKHGRYGRFLACPSFPECRYTKKVVKDTGVECPLDGGMIVERRSRKGRTFYGCGNYPACEYSLWNKPLPERCPECNSLLTEHWKNGDMIARCSNRDCGYEQERTTEIAAARN